jgi:hypothetical protein
MPEFKISPATQCKTRPRSSFLFWFLSLIIVLEAMFFGCWIFHLNAQIAKLEQQISTTQPIENGGKYVQR